VDKPFTDYVLGTPYDEMFLPDGTPRPHAAALYDALTTLPADELVRRQQACEQSFLHQGITFTVYGHHDATEKIIPTDLLPRIVPGKEWDKLEAGLRQRITALNHVPEGRLQRGAHPQCRDRALGTWSTARSII
jgi:uncharacterized circularly permuted ATP-grasp superfamily protein